MTTRREFSTAVRQEIIDRATIDAAVSPTRYVRVQCCESCGAQIHKREFHIDHIVAEELCVDKSVKLTAKDGQLLCYPCHDEKTDVDKATIAEARHRKASATGARRPSAFKIPSAPFPKFERPLPSDRRARIDKSAIPALPRKDLGK